MFRNLFSKSRLIVICSIIVLACASAALAHPLGNFTINQFARLHIADQRLDVHCVVDMAEIPAFQEMQIIDTDGDGEASEAELNAYGERQAAEYLKGLSITVDGDPVALKPLAPTVTRPAGAGGLTTLRLEMDYSGAISSNAAAATVTGPS